VSTPPGQRYLGECHCGSIGFVYTVGKEPQAWSVRACQCSFCRAHHALSTSDPSAWIEFLERVPGRLNRYRFGQRTADFLLCRDCGVYIGAVIATAKGRFGIINVNALHPLPEALKTAEPMHYDGETAEQRSLRREQRWSRVVGAPWPA